MVKNILLFKSQQTFMHFCRFALQGSDSADQGMWLHTVQLLPIVVTSEEEINVETNKPNAFLFLQMTLASASWWGSAVSLPTVSMATNMTCT